MKVGIDIRYIIMKIMAKADSAVRKIFTEECYVMALSNQLLL